jgi:hypothetical protein
MHPEMERGMQLGMAMQQQAMIQAMAMQQDQQPGTMVMQPGMQPGTAMQPGMQPGMAMQQQALIQAMAMQQGMQPGMQPAMAMQPGMQASTMGQGTSAQPVQNQSILMADPPADPTKAAANSESSFCGSCGAQPTEGAQFCSKCCST